MLQVSHLSGFGARKWWHPRAALHLDFVNGRYYWGGKERNASSSFASWTGVTLTQGSGLTTSGNRGVSVLTSQFMTGTTGTLAVSFRSISTGGTTEFMAELWNGTSSESARITKTTAPSFSTQIRNSNVGQATFTDAHDTSSIHAIAVSWTTNQVNQAFDGVSAPTDTSAAVPSAFTELVTGGPTTYVREIVFTMDVLTSECAKLSGDLRR